MGKKVYGIEYTVKNSRGEVVDSNVGEKPLEFIGNTGQIIPGLEKAIQEMEVGEERVVQVPAQEAYGEYNPDLQETLPREQFAGIDLEKGMVLYGQAPDGHVIAVRVKDFNDHSVTIDYNHPLAGEDLTFNVKLISQRDATLEEISTGVVGGGHHCNCENCSCDGEHHHHHHH
jgi:FKBP-type peptidyl-prolyl cis-trans isomerase SlyD